MSEGLLWRARGSLRRHETVCDLKYHSDTVRGVRVCVCVLEWSQWAYEE